MRIMLIKLLLRLLSDNSYSKVNDKKIQEWLMSLESESSGYKGYYTLRKKAITDVISLGVEQKEYWVNMGRLAELRNINTLSKDLIKKYASEKRSEQKGDR